MAEAYEWLYEILINFIRSPMWKSPIHSFIDEYCTAFDGDTENQLDHTEIHKNFCKVVDDLLENLFSEMEIDFSIFVDACKSVTPDTNEAHVIDQLTKVQDFDTFKGVMSRRNEQLNEEAMKVLV
jgi:hypothetical protein